MMTETIGAPDIVITFGLFTGAPARTVGWRDPGHIHTAFLKELWPNRVYAL